jgi:hypothetical protein
MKEKKYHLFHPHGGRVRPPEKTKNKKYHPRETFVSSQKKSIIATFFRPKKKRKRKKEKKKEGYPSRRID